MTIIATIDRLLQLDSITVREHRRLTELQSDKLASLTHADVAMIQSMETHHFDAIVRKVPVISRGPLFPKGDPRNHD